SGHAGGDEPRPAQHPEEAESADAAVRIDVETNVGERPAVLELVLEVVASVGLELGAREDLSPRDAGPARIGAGAGLAALDHGGIGVVALEMVGVDLDPAQRGFPGQL